jgi:CheY-like chemotaxis protein/anti-sigma regulatory factor (Ser/Thr protein kinase)
MRKSEIAEESSKAKSAFLANMSHEIRTPINAIWGIAEILMQNDQLPDDVLEGLEKIDNSCNMLLGIINDILDFSKIEAGKLDITPVIYNTADIINDTVHLNMVYIGDKPIEFELEVDENIPIKLIGDELRIKQILSNLLSNAFKYTETGKVTLTFRVEPNTQGVLLVFEVRDTGSGMTKEQVTKLFEEYSRFEQSTDTVIEGTGLGLSIVNRLIALMGGEVYVESEPGKGSLFTVRLPQDTASAEILGRELAESMKQFRTDYRKNMKRRQIIRDYMPHGRVLIVDDVPTNLYVAEGLMKPYGLQIETVSSGFEAIDKVNSGKEYDIIFMDHMMPKMDGIETTKRLRDSGYAAPIAVLTANAVTGQADMFLQNGFDAFISKPIDIRHLNSILNKFIGSRERLPEENVADEADDSSAVAALMIDTGIAGIGISKALERYNGDVQLFLRVLRSYAANVRSLLGSIETVCEDTLGDYKITVHGIKGASYDVFAESVGKKSENLEKAAVAGDLDYIREHNPVFLDAAHKLINNVETMINKIDDETPRPKKDKPDRELLEKLADACEFYHMDGVNEAMKEIDLYEYEADDGLGKWLRENVDLMNFGQIAEKLKEITGGT